MHSRRGSGLYAWRYIVLLAVVAIPRNATAEAANDPNEPTSKLAAQRTEVASVGSEPLTAPVSGGPARDESIPSGQENRAPRRHAEERPFAFVIDPTTPSAGDASVEYRLGYASGTAADRPLPTTVAPTGAEHSLTLGYGVTSRIAPAISVRLLQPTRGEGSVQATANVGARFQLTDPDDARLRVALATALFREFEGSFGVSARAVASYDMQRLRVAANLHLERVFASDRDAVDVLVMAGASYRMLEAVRVGLEYVGQDLEGAFEDDEAEGGAHHYVGPNLALALLGDRLQIVAAGAAGIGTGAQPMVGRLAMLMSF